MPEQFSNITQMIDDNAKVRPPCHDTDALQNIELTLRANIQETIILRWWQHGLEQQWVCLVEAIDTETQTIFITKDQECFPVYFPHIYEVIPFGNRYTIDGD